jgi:AcrR family transcriptional regulator
VAAAARAFGEHGYAGTSTTLVAREARTSKREIYCRFAGKDALFEEVMTYLCSLGASAAPPRARPAATIEGHLRQIARDVVTRFVLPETGPVLAAAIGATAQFPSVLEQFWQQGPGQAAAAVAALLQAHHGDDEHPGARYAELAVQFIHDACGPVVLHQLFDADYNPDSDRIGDSIDAAVRRLKRRLKAAGVGAG